MSYIFTIVKVKDDKLAHTEFCAVAVRMRLVSWLYKNVLCRYTLTGLSLNEEASIVAKAQIPL